MIRSSTKTLISALNILADEIQSGDGVANAAILEAAERLEQLRNCSLVIVGLHGSGDLQRLPPFDSLCVNKLLELCE